MPSRRRRTRRTSRRRDFNKNRSSRKRGRRGSKSRFRAGSAPDTRSNYKAQLELTAIVLQKLGADSVETDGAGILDWETYMNKLKDPAVSRMELLKIRSTRRGGRLQSKDTGTNSLISDVDVTVYLYNAEDVEMLRHALEGKYEQMLRLDVNFYPEPQNVQPIPYTVADGQTLLKMKVMSLDKEENIDSEFVKKLSDHLKDAFNMKVRHNNNGTKYHEMLYKEIFKFLLLHINSKKKDAYLAWRFLLPDGYALHYTFNSYINADSVPKEHNTLAFLENAICLSIHTDITKKPKYIKRMCMALKHSTLYHPPRVIDPSKKATALPPTDMWTNEWIDTWIGLADSWHAASRRSGLVDTNGINGLVIGFCVVIMLKLFPTKSSHGLNCNIGQIAYNVLTNEEFANEVKIDILAQNAASKFLNLIQSQAPQPPADIPGNPHQPSRQRREGGGGVRVTSRRVDPL